MPILAPGELSLTKLLCGLHVSLAPATFVFLTLPLASPPPPTLEVLMSFREVEGLTIIAPLDSVEKHKLDYVFPCRKITCEIHSSLEAVGFLAAITKRLAERGIGVNPISGYYHDHLFVPVEGAVEAVKALEELAEEAAQQSHG